MKTTHQFVFKNSKKMNTIKSESVDLIVTSPPYPMIQMWDKMFTAQDRKIRDALLKHQGPLAFELMNKKLDEVWDEVERILKPGGFACINIGDAARTIKDNFMLYPNHSRILTHMLKRGFTSLPVILWRKQTNAPNKFMGSGMLPAGAYVTLEHEYILILRKGGKREFFRDQDKMDRRKSAIFWEERNDWFSDVWMDLKGTVQKLKDDNVRKRSAAYPFELPYRLISMFSVKGDVVVDPFFGIGTTMLAAMTTGRNSIGYEVENDFRDTIISRMDTAVEFSNKRITTRLENHIDFLEKRYAIKGGFKHKNEPYGFPVITMQEKALLLNQLESVKKIKKDLFEVTYSDDPQNEFCDDWASYFSSAKESAKPKKKKAKGKKSANQVQLDLI